MKISEIITKKYKLRIPPTVYYDLLADVLEAEEEQETNTKNDLGVDCIKKSDAIDIIQDMHGLARADVISDAVNRIITMSSVTLQEPKTGRWKPNFRYGMYPSEEHFICSECNGQSMRQSKYCPECGSRMEGGD